MTQPAKAQEPSMEEILASIRRIIADDDASKSAQRAPEPPRAEPPPPPPAPVFSAPPRPAPEPEPVPPMSDSIVDDSADILDLTESMTAKPEPAPSPQFRTIDAASDVGFDEPVERPEPRAPAREEIEPSRLLSSATTAAVDSAFNALAQTVLVQNSRTLEDLVREMLRPMLKSWLDDNLPGLVERLVRTEIERVSRGRTG